LQKPSNQATAPIHVLGTFNLPPPIAIGYLIENSTMKASKKKYKKIFLLAEEAKKKGLPEGSAV